MGTNDGTSASNNAATPTAAELSGDHSCRCWCWSADASERATRVPEHWPASHIRCPTRRTTGPSSQHTSACSCSNSSAYGTSTTNHATSTTTSDGTSATSDVSSTTTSSDGTSASRGSWWWL